MLFLYINNVISVIGIYLYITTELYFSYVNKSKMQVREFEMVLCIVVSCEEKKLETQSKVH